MDSDRAPTNQESRTSRLDSVPVLAIGAGVLLAWLAPIGLGLAAAEDSGAAGLLPAGLAVAAGLIVARVALSAR